MPQQMARRLLPAAAALGMLIAMILGASASAQPLSKAEAMKEGNPAATAPVGSTPSVITFEGRRINEAQVVARGLACLDTATGYLCKKNQSEFAAEEQAAGEEGEATPDCAEVTFLWVYQHKQYEGASDSLAARGEWRDVPGWLNNETTSFRMGDYSGHLSDYSGGGGYWYPGDTGICAYQSNIANVYPGWNDRITSRYRNP